jgi:hypothetical protein
LAAPSFAAYPCGKPKATVSDRTVDPGETVTVSGINWLPGSTVRIYFEQRTSTLIGTATVKPNGTFSKNVTIPSTAKPGTAGEIVVKGRGCNGKPATVTIHIKVNPGHGGGNGGGHGRDPARGFAFTGGDLVVSFVVFVALMSAGLILLGAARRRRRRAAEATVEG